MPNTRALQPPWRSLCSVSSGFDSRPHLPCVSFHEVKLCPRLFDRGCVAAGGESHLANFSGGVILRSATCPRQIPPAVGVKECLQNLVYAGPERSAAYRHAGS